MTTGSTRFACSTIRSISLRIAAGTKQGRPMSRMSNRPPCMNGVYPKHTLAPCRVVTTRMPLSANRASRPMTSSSGSRVLSSAVRRAAGSVSCACSWPEMRVNCVEA